MEKKNNNIKRIIKKRIEDNGIMIKNENKNVVKILLRTDKINSNMKKETNYSINEDINGKSSYNNLFTNNVSDFYLKVLFVISNYMREEMLKSLLDEIKNINIKNIEVDYIIFDDVSPYKINDSKVIVNEEHRGKELYWKTFNDMFQYCKKNVFDVYVFTPNDFLNYDFERMFNYCRKLYNYCYVFNIINDGREMSWNFIKPIKIDNDVYQVFFTDCGFFCSRKALEILNFTVDPINSKRFQKKEISSGVGQQITMKLVKFKVPIFMPVKSLAFHGNHESLMHPESRGKNKLVSI